MKKVLNKAGVAVAISAVLYGAPVHAQSQSDNADAENMERIVTLGSRVNGRTATESASRLILFQVIS